VFDPKLIPGGSSSGSGVAVAAGLVPFSLGTDTAGSGRVPAGLGNIVGLKPSLGVVSNAGVVPACRTLDCMTVFTDDTADARLVDSVVGCDISFLAARRMISSSSFFAVAREVSWICASPDGVGPVRTVMLPAPSDCTFNELGTLTENGRGVRGSRRFGPLTSSCVVGRGGPLGPWALALTAACCTEGGRELLSSHARFTRMIATSIVAARIFIERSF
jgi:hypothetical protein